MTSISQSSSAKSDRPDQSLSAYYLVWLDTASYSTNNLFIRQKLRLLNKYSTNQIIFKHFFDHVLQKVKSSLLSVVNVVEK